MRDRAWYVARRLALLVPLLGVVSLLVFSLLYLAPGDAVQTLLGTRPRSRELVATLRAEHHLDRPFLEQYWLWLRDALQLDFGTSIRNGRPVASMLSSRLGVSGFLVTYAAVIAIGLGVPLGVLAAMRRASRLDRGIVGIGVLGLSTPAFVSSVILLYVFSVSLGWFPTFGAGSGFADRLWHLTLPAFALALVVMAIVLKLTRAAMIGALEQDYVAFALARGVPMGRVLVRHALPNALVPLITAVGIVVIGLITGAVLVEATFSLPGIGSLFVAAIDGKDVPVVQALALLIGCMVVLVNLVVDVLYTFADPRIAFGRTKR